MDRARIYALLCAHMDDDEAIMRLVELYARTSSEDLAAVLILLACVLPARRREALCPRVMAILSGPWAARQRHALPANLTIMGVA